MDSNLTKILQAMSGSHDYKNQLIRLLAKKPKTGKRKVLRFLRRTHFIDGLRPELTTWRIKAMVVSKSRIIEPNDQRQKTFFNVDLVDKSGKEIRATAFKENLKAGTFEKYYEMFQIDKTYYLSNLDVQTVSVFQKSPIKNHFELMFNDSTKIIEYEETPKVKVNFVCIKDVLQQETESFVGKRKVLILRRTHFIDGLRPELKKWGIKAVVVCKSRILESNDQRQKTFFNVDLVDKSGKEIRATAFKENLKAGTFEKYYDMFQIDKTYYLSNLDVQTVRVFQKSPIKNRFELMFNDSTKIIEYEETPKVKFNFVCIKDVLQQETESFADIIGICIRTGHLREITEHGVPEITRNITLVDTTEACIVVHLRGPEAVKFDGSRRPVVAIKNGYVTSFTDRDTGYCENRVMADCYRLNPDIYNTLNLREWEQWVGY